MESEKSLSHRLVIAVPKGRPLYCERCLAGISSHAGFVRGPGYDWHLLCVDCYLGCFWACLRPISRFSWETWWTSRQPAAYYAHDAH